MKIKDYIKELKKMLKTYGNLDLIYYDETCNTFRPFDDNIQAGYYSEIDELKGIFKTEICIDDLLIDDFESDQTINAVCIN